MSKNTNTIMNVEVKSELTDKTVINFKSNDSVNARSEAYERIAKFLGINKAIASLNYYVEIN